LNFGRTLAYPLKSTHVMMRPLLNPQLSVDLAWLYLICAYKSTFSDRLALKHLLEGQINL